MSVVQNTDMLDLVVTDIRVEAPSIRSVTFASYDGAALPEWSAGAHIDLSLPSGEKRSYSLINISLQANATKAPSSYRIGVRREEASLGGSAFVHGLKVGDRVTSTSPKNHFPLHRHAGEIFLLAGGIGITPIISMASELAAAGHPFNLIYAGRTRASLAFLPELSATFGGNLQIHEDDRSGMLDLELVMRTIPAASPLYLCGPISMIDKARSIARAFQWDDDRLRFEIFTRPDSNKDGAEFEVVLAASGRRFMVPPDKSILDVLIEHGEEPVHDCKRGDCGMCQVVVLDGIPDHRDYYLSDRERAANGLIQICVSRSKTSSLTLDM